MGSEEEQLLGLENFHSILKNRRLRPEDRVPEFSQLICVVESYYNLDPIDLTHPTEAIVEQPESSEHPPPPSDDGSGNSPDDCSSETSECQDPTCDLCLRADCPDQDSVGSPHEPRPIPTEDI